MRCTKLEVTILFGVGVFLIGTVSLVAVTVHNVFPAREEQNLKAINCTIASANMQAKAKCQHKTRDDSSHRCLRVYVLCGKDAKRNDSLARVQPKLLRKDFHSLQKQVSTDACWVFVNSVLLNMLFFTPFEGHLKLSKIWICPSREKSHFLYFSTLYDYYVNIPNIIVQKVVLLHCSHVAIWNLITWLTGPLISFVSENELISSFTLIHRLLFSLELMWRNTTNIWKRGTFFAYFCFQCFRWRLFEIAYRGAYACVDARVFSFPNLSRTWRPGLDENLLVSISLLQPNAKLVHARQRS